MASPEGGGGDLVGAQRIAARAQGDSTPANNGVFFLLGDHLGSTSKVISAAGQEVGELRYREASRSDTRAALHCAQRSAGERRDKAFGEARFASGRAPTDYRYTAQREEAGIGLYYYNARWYDPGLGRFISADTVTSASDGMARERYAYVRHNPLRHTDPSGMKPCDGENFESCGRTQPSTGSENGSMRYSVGSPSGWQSPSDDRYGDGDNHGDGNDWIPAMLVSLDALTPIDLLFNPWLGSFVLPDAEQYDQMRDYWLQQYGEMYGESVTRMSFDEIVKAAEGGVNNPVSDSQAGIGAGALLMRSGYKPYTMFLMRLGLGTGPQHAMNYEPFFLDALMERKPRLLHEVQLQYEADLQEEVYQVLKYKGGLVFGAR